MKKISTIIALALIVTIGSVYAAWNYAHGTAASSDVTREINMAQVTTNSNKGSIAVTPENIAFLVDDAGSYVATLTGSGHFDVIFTPANGADNSTVTSGIHMIATVSIVESASAQKYTYNYKDGDDDKSVVVTPLVADETIVAGKATNVIDLGTCKETTLTAAQIIGAIKFCVNDAGEEVEVKLPTKADNDNFHEVLKGYTIKIVISEQTIAP